jgi:hypothetical protein
LPLASLVSFASCLFGCHPRRGSAVAFAFAFAFAVAVAVAFAVAVAVAVAFAVAVRPGLAWGFSPTTNGM